MQASRFTLPLIVAAQFAGTSLWFVGNATLGELAPLWPEVDGAVGWMTSGVQLGFIVGTFVFALSGISDRIPAHRLFFGSALAGAVSTAASMLAPASFVWFLLTRVLTGFFLAGVYPVGMKLAASWFPKGLGAAIGWLVGALVLGTAFPHLLSTFQLDATVLTLTTAALAALAGVVVLLWVPQGPAVKSTSRTSVRDALGVFQIPDVRGAALGYFGHMWELYAFWAFVPLVLASVVPGASASEVSLYAFLAIGAGGLGCVVGGIVSGRVGSAAVARFMLRGSGLCAVLSPAVFLWGAPWMSVAFVLVWGTLVAGDSPQFSAVAASASPPERVGTALTLINAVGFSLTIGSLQLLSALVDVVPPAYLFVALVPGPLLGVLAFRRVGR
ncbi:MAG: MFS transporter [Nannocystaceae bacterium]|nr:MFS transporter [bacterium]